MLVEVYNIGGDSWAFKDENGVEFSITIGTGLKPKEAECQNNIEIVKSLKKQGFETDEIIELFKAKVL